MKSKMMVLFVISVLLLMVLSIPLETKHVLAASTEGIVKATTLNVREAASTSSKKIGSIKKGQRVTIIKQQSGWLQIKYGSKNGWVSKQYISTVDSTTAATVAATTCYVTASSLNIRQSATTSSKVVASVRKGDPVTYYSKSNNWAKVKTISGGTGWASMAYLSNIEPVVMKNYYVTANSLNVRASGSTKAKVLSKLNRGDFVTYYTQSNNWAKIQTKSGVTGYVSMDYLSTTKPTAGSKQEQERDLKGKVIVLDPGHGAHDPGALGENNTEKDLTLATAKKLKAKLETAGAKVIMTRTEDTYLTLSERVQISKKNNADVFISIHFNSSASESANGMETYYWTTYKNESKLAELVQKELIKSTGLSDRKSATGNFHVIRENNNSAILVELGFISNPDEEKIIATSDFQNKAATGIVNGLEAYFDLF